MPETKNFIKLERSVKGEYLRKKVPKNYQKRYGKRYGKKDVKSIAFAIAKSRKISIHN